MGIIRLSATTAIYVTPKGQVASALPFIFSGPDRPHSTISSKDAIANSVQSYDVQKHYDTQIYQSTDALMGSLSL